MAKKERYPDGYYRPSIRAGGESQDSGSSGRTDAEMTASEDSSAPIRKCINLNSGGFRVPVQVHLVSRMSVSEKQELITRLRLELQQIRNWQRKFESSRMVGMALSSSSDILSCSNGQSARPVSAKSKKGIVPGPKARVHTHVLPGRLENAQQHTPVPGGSLRLAMKQCEQLLERLMSHQCASMFNTPVDVVGLNIPDYPTIIKNPMDLGTVKGKLASGSYSSPHEFCADVRLTFSNAMTYNPVGNYVHNMARTLSKFFETRWKTIEKKLPRVEAETLPEKVDVRQQIEPAQPPSKKRKVPSVPPAVLPQPVHRRMSADEKHRLSSELESLLSDLPESIVSFLRKHCSNGGEDDEIEIDLDDLNAETLFELRKLIDEHKDKQKSNVAKLAEPCEIELLHGSGISNSSMQAGKGNDLDEDIDIGGSEPPVSSYPPVEIDKDLVHRSESSNSEMELEHAKAPFSLSRLPEAGGIAEEINNKTGRCNPHDDNKYGSGLDQPGKDPEEKLTYDDSQLHLDGDSAANDRQLSPDKQYRAALLKSRFADTILKAREKTLSKQDEKMDPEKLRREREELEVQRRKEKARLQAEAKAAEDARKRAEAEAAAEAKRKREQEREAARQALLQMEKTVDINDTSIRTLEDLEMLRSGPVEHLPSSVDETSPDHAEEGLGGFMFGGGSNPLEQLGLFMKVDEEEEEAEPPSFPGQLKDVEEGEID